jgi:ribosomal protein L31
MIQEIRRDIYGVKLRLLIKRTCSLTAQLSCESCQNRHRLFQSEKLKSISVHGSVDQFQKRKLCFV